MRLNLKRIGRFIGPSFAVLMFAGALWVLHNELKHVPLRELIAQVRQIPGRKTTIAFGLTLLSYLILTGYDTLGFVYLGRRLEYRRIGLASFLGYAFSHNLGFAALTGPAIRYRVYSAWNLSAFDVTKLFAFCSATYWLGYLALSGSFFLAEPLPLPDDFHLSAIPMRPLGILMIALLLAYLYWTGVRRRELKIRSWVFPPPPVPLSFLSVALSCVDWAVAASVLYVLLPTGLGIGFTTFLSMFLLAQLVAVLCHVPGGIGVFESLMLLFLKPYGASSAILGTLVVYRCIYYLVPLGVAILLLAGHEILRRHGFMRRVLGTMETLSSPLVPNLLSIGLFLSGSVLLLSGASPSERGRLHWLREIVSLPAVEISHFLGSIAGATLLILARAVQRRSRAAYYAASILLLLGIIASLVKGWDYEEATILAFVLIALLPCRRYFYRHASILYQRFSAGWIVAVAIILLCTFWLCMFSYKHVEYHNELWWHFGFRADAPRSLRALVGVAAVVLFFTFARLLGPARPRPSRPTREEQTLVEHIVRAASRTDACLALLGDKSLLFNEQRDAFIMYAVSGRSWIAMGDPVGPPERRRELAWNYLELCDAFGGQTVFYEVSDDNLTVYTEMGLSLAKVGEDALISLEDFSLEGSTHRDLRQVRNRFIREGFLVAITPRGEADAILPALRRVSDAWLEEKNTREKGFSLGRFDEAYLRHFPIAVLRNETKIVAFANLWEGAGKAELSIDLMRFTSDAPSGVMDYLFTELILWGKAQGYKRFNLGMAPLAGLSDHPLAPVWNKVGNAVFRLGEHFYNFRGLRQYKEKFHPSWQPRYLAYPGGLTLPSVLLDLGSLTSGGLTGILSK